MQQNSLILTAAGLTTFVLVLAGGVAGQLTATPAVPTAVVLEVPTETWPTEIAPVVDVVQPTAGLDPTVEALLREREAA